MLAVAVGPVTVSFPPENSIIAAVGIQTACEPAPPPATEPRAVPETRRQDGAQGAPPRLFYPRVFTGEDALGAAHVSGEEVGRRWAARGRTLTVEEAVDGGRRHEGAEELTQDVHGKPPPGHAA